MSLLMFVSFAFGWSNPGMVQFFLNSGVVERSPDEFPLDLTQRQR
jgi:hypothetical protein